MKFTITDQKVKYIDIYNHKIKAIINEVIRNFVFSNKNKNIQSKDIRAKVIPVTKPYNTEYFKLFL